MVEPDKYGLRPMTPIVPMYPVPYMYHQQGRRTRASFHAQRGVRFNFFDIAVTQRVIKRRSHVVEQQNLSACVMLPLVVMQLNWTRSSIGQRGETPNDQFKSGVPTTRPDITNFVLTDIY